MNRLGLQSPEDLLRTVYIISRRLPGGDYGCVFMSPSPSLNLSSCAMEGELSNGMCRVRLSESKLKSTVKGLHSLGYFVLLERHQAIEPWFRSLDNLPLVGEDEPSFLYDDLAYIGDCIQDWPTVVEPFGHGHSLIMAKNPSPVEVRNDSDDGVLKFFSVLRSPDNLGWFFVLSRIFPPGEVLDPVALRQYLSLPREDDVTRSFAWYCNMRSTFAEWKKFSESEAESLWENEAVLGQTGLLQMVDPLLPAIRDRLMRIQHESNSWEKMLEIYDTKDTLFWVDIPDYGPYKFDIPRINEVLDRLEKCKGSALVYAGEQCDDTVLSRILADRAAANPSVWREFMYELACCTVYEKRQ